MEFLRGLLAEILRPIIQEQFNELKQFISQSVARKKAYEKFDRKAQELIEQAENASTTEEVKAHLRRLKEFRATLDV